MVLLRRLRLGYTSVSNHFIDYYLQEAPGEFVKVYLCLLRLMEEPESEISVATLADRLANSEKDVMRALTYWAKKGILVLEHDQDELIRVEAVDVQPPAEAPQTVLASEPEGSYTVKEASASEEKQVEPDQQADSSSWDGAGEDPLSAYWDGSRAVDEDFKMLLTAAEYYLVRPIVSKDIDLFVYLHDELGFSYELIEYLVEYCVGRGKNDVRYMEEVALNWHRKGIDSVSDAKQESQTFCRDNRAVMKAFGITGRVLGKKERDFVDHWINEDKFSLDLVVEACDHTMTAIHSPSFEYTDKILRAWKEAGVKEVSDARRVSEERRQAAEARREQGKTRTAANRSGAPNRFHNFEQRKVNYDALLEGELGFRKKKKADTTAAAGEA